MTVCMYRDIHTTTLYYRSTPLEPPDPENGRTMLLQYVSSYFPVHMA